MDCMEEIPSSRLISGALFYRALSNRHNTSKKDISGCENMVLYTCEVIQMIDEIDKREVVSF